MVSRNQSNYSFVNLILQTLHVVFGQSVSGEVYLYNGPELIMLITNIICIRHRAL